MPNEVKFLLAMVFMVGTMFFTLGITNTVHFWSKCESAGGVAVRGYCFRKDVILMRELD